MRHIAGSRAWPRLLILPAILFLILVLAAGKGAAPAVADTPPCAYGCTVEVEFHSIAFPKLDDCTWGAPCDLYEQSIQAYGSFGAATWKNGVFGSIKKLKLAGWGDQPSFCPGGGVDWRDGSVGRASCFRRVSNQVGDLEPPYFLSETFLCKASSNTLCSGAFLKNNNRLTLTVKPGESIVLSSKVYDYDALSADDIVCNAGRSLGPFTAQQLASLNATGSMSTAFNGDGACTVGFTVKRVG